MARYQVYGYYDDEPQVVIDVVDAASEDEAIAIIEDARAAKRGTGYVSDGAGLLEDALENIKDLLQRPAEDIAAGIAALREQYAHWHDDTEEGDKELS